MSPRKKEKKKNHTTEVYPEKQQTITEHNSVSCGGGTPFRKQRCVISAENIVKAVCGDGVETIRQQEEQGKFAQTLTRRKTKKQLTD